MPQELNIHGDSRVVIIESFHFSDLNSSLHFSDIFRVFCADHTYTTLALPYQATAQTIVNTAEERVLLGDDCLLCEVKSSGGLFISFFHNFSLV